MLQENLDSDTIKSDDITLKEFLTGAKKSFYYLWHKKWIIIAAGIIGGLLGITYSFIKKTNYTATTTFVLETGEKSSLGQYAGVASMMGIDLGGGGGGIFQGENILELFTSRTMIENTLLSPTEVGSKELLIDRYIRFNKLKKGWKKKPRLLNLSFTRVNLKDREIINARLDSNVLLRDSVLGKITQAINKNYLSVTKPDKKLSIIEVNVEAKDEIFAKNFNTELVKNVTDFYVSTKTKKMVNNVTILQHKTDSVRAVMNGDIYKAISIVDATPNLNPTRQVQRMAPVQKAQFSSETNKMVLSELVKNLEMAKITLLKETPLTQIVDQPIYPLQNDKLGKLKSLIIGAFLGGIIIIMVLLLKRFVNNLK